MHRERRGPGEDEDEVYPSGRSGRASVKARCGCFVRGNQVLKVRFVPGADIDICLFIESTSIEEFEKNVCSSNKGVWKGI